MEDFNITVIDVGKMRRKIFNETKKNMVSLGTYRKEFDVIIQRYAEMRMQFDMLNERWYREGCRVTEKYTNKAGATNERKTALYLAAIANTPLLLRALRITFTFRKRAFTGE